MADIDSLQIKIKADANSASNALDKLAVSLESFRKSVAWDTGKLYSIGTGIKNISDAATGFKGAKSKELSSLATALNNFDKVDTVSLRGVGSAMESLAHSMSGIQSIDVSGITSTAAAIAKLGGKNATQGTTNLLAMKDQLAEFIKGMNSVGTMTFDSTGLLNTANAINKLGSKFSTQATQNLPAMSAQLQNFVRQMNSIGALNFDTTNLANLVTSISKLGSVASGRAVENIPLLAENLKNLFTTLSTAPNVSRNIISMTEALANLARTGSSSGRAAQSLGKSLDIFSKSTSTAKTKSFSLASAIGKLYATYFVFFRGFSKIKDAIDISSDLTEVENVVRQTFGNYESLIQDFSKTSIQQYGMSELTAKQVSSRFQAMGTAMGFTQGKMADMSLELTKLTGDLASFYNEEQSDVARRLQSVFTGETEPLRRYGLDLSQATLKEYALSKGLDANISSMTQAEKTMLRYQYVIENTANAQGDFARTSDTWANQIKMLKQSFEAWSAVVGGALINAFKPFVRTLNDVMQKVIAFTTTVTNALGSIFGWQYEISDGGIADDWSDGMSDFSDAIGDASDNANKLKNNLLGIDELNVLSKDNDSSSGSGSSGTGAAGAGKGQLVQVDTIFKDYESNIKDLYTLGQTISETISSALEGIDWQSIYEKARNFGTGLAQFLNGLITPTLFGDVGSTIASALNTALYTAISFGQEFDFYKYGVSIATGINIFFETFDFEALGTAINTWVQGLKSTIIGFLDTIKPGDVFKGLIDTLSNISLDTITFITTGFLLKKGSAYLTKDLFKTLIKRKLVGDTATAISIDLGTVVFSIIPKIAMNFNPGMIGEIGIWIEQNIINGSFLDTSTWSTDGIMSKIDGFLWNIAYAIGDSLESIIVSTLNFDTTLELFDIAGNWFSSIEEDFKNKEWGKIGLDILMGVLTGFTGAISAILEPVADFFIGIWDAICDVFGIHSPAKEMKPLGEYILLGVVDGFKSRFNDFTTAIQIWFNTKVKPWFTLEKWTGIVTNIKTSLTNTWNKFTTWWNETGFKKWWDNVTSYFTVETWNWSGIKEGLSNAWNNAVEAVKQIWNNFANWLNEKLTWTIDPVVVMGKTLFEGTTISLGKIPTFETGGYVPSRYTMFMAGENGIPEIAGTVGGKTAVAGGAEITGIRDAINSTAEAQMQIMQQEINLLKQLLAKEMSVNIGDREIARANLRGQKSMGLQIIT